MSAVRTADVVVVGGGANGTSTAFHLAKLGVKNVVLLEQRQIAAGATGKSGSLVRMHYTNDTESRLALESLKVFQDFGNVVGSDCGWSPVGFVQLVKHEHRDALHRNIARQQKLGIDTRLIDDRELRELLPGVIIDDVGGAAYEKSSGFADPNATAFGFAAAAQRMGVSVETGVKVTRVLVENGRVAGVETERERIMAPNVVLVPGAWATPLLRPLGLDLPLTPFRIQISIFRWPPGWTHRHPVVIDAVHHSWMRPEGVNATLIGVELGRSGADPETYDEGVDPQFVRDARTTLASRLPAFADATMRGGWAGMIMMSEDGRPIIDQFPSIPGLYGMLGDSGTSFKTSPAIGRCLAEWIAHGKPRLVDLTPFRASRFAEGKPWVDEDHYGRERLTISR
jgi:sarcosine oxidase subunit beta